MNNFKKIKDWEVLIGVNGFELNSEVYNFAKKFENEKIRVFEYNFQDKSKTSNELLKESLYDIICVIDVDDKWEKTKLEKQLDYINKYDVVGTRCYYIDENDEITGEPNIPSGEVKEETILYY